MLPLLGGAILIAAIIPVAFLALLFFARFVMLPILTWFDKRFG